MHQPKTLSSTQIRYLRIGPQVNQSKLLKQQLIEALQQEKRQQGAQFTMGNGNLNKIPKFSYGQMSRTVNNFGVLINQNFGTLSTLHQMQKFGKLAKHVDKIMQTQKDKPIQSTKNANDRHDKPDTRTLIKSIYNYQGEKIFVTLHSFSIQAVEQNYKEILPFSFLKLLLSKVSSSKITRTIEAALKYQGNGIDIKYQKLQEKAGFINNNQEKYQNLVYKFQKLGTQFKINVPYLEFSHIESEFKMTAIATNKDILQTIQQQFENVHDIIYKYFDHDGFANNITPQRQEYSEMQMSPSRFVGGEQTPGNEEYTEEQDGYQDEQQNNQMQAQQQYDQNVDASQLREGQQNDQTHEEKSNQIIQDQQETAHNGLPTPMPQQDDEQTPQN